ncbi:class I SAM-dependent methyltransferase [Kordia sp. YSTF-M3]|uniref:Class I SAM-dependent methyltransferase n=1 Tax=Kordia aestuariivivens TaxID=2759037 RepID=A0ABR7Q7G8_9FLAO|nr:class I SAM-dependent methyltransferase [Kordia aestuariivivens]MBC8754517.1 class I SAM-dependent methyltransferase [Kordia aestuariivivens]
MLFSTEVTSSKITSDNPLFQRTLKAYHVVAPHIHGNVLEIGCGEGYGVELLYKNSDQLTLIDKSPYTAELINSKYPNTTIIQEKIPPLTQLENNSFDVVVSFQVIEHIKEAALYLEEIHRVLKPNGKAYISTPNALKTIARNPWHYKEYTFEDLVHLFENNFTNYTIKAIQGNAKTAAYYEKNKESVARFLRYDIFNLEHKIPSWLLQIPYEIANRMNRKKLLHKNPDLVNTITLEDYSLGEHSEATLDFFCTLTK